MATVVGSPIWNTYGYLQGGLTLNGSSQYAYASDNVAFDLTTGAVMTISAWVLPGSFGATSVYPILAHGTAYELSLAGGTTSKGVAFTVNGVTVNPSSNQTTLLGNGSWHLITATLSGGAATLYIDGTAVGTATGINLPATDTGTLYLGRDSTNYFNGRWTTFACTARACRVGSGGPLQRACGEHRGNDQRGLGAWRHGDVHGDADRFNRQPPTVYYTVSGSGTTNGVNYVYLPGMVTIPAGQSSAAITVTPIDIAIGSGGTIVLMLAQDPNSQYDLSHPVGTATVNLVPSIGQVGNWQFDAGSGTTVTNSDLQRSHFRIPPTCRAALTVIGVAESNCVLFQFIFVSAKIS